MHTRLTVEIQAFGRIGSDPADLLRGDVTIVGIPRIIDFDFHLADIDRAGFRSDPLVRDVTGSAII